MKFLEKLIKSVEADFGKPLPKKEKREGESNFEHKIRQWTEEVKDRPKRFPGGRDQAIAIAAEQAGVGKGAFTSGYSTGAATGSAEGTPGAVIGPPSAAAARGVEGVASRGGQQRGNSGGGNRQSPGFAGTTANTAPAPKPAGASSRDSRWDNIDLPKAMKACKACKGSSPCDDHADLMEKIAIPTSTTKALTTRDLVIPFQARLQAMAKDPYRAATTQPTQGYTALQPNPNAPEKEEKFDSVREHAIKTFEKHSQHVQDVRKANQQHANEIRKSMWWTK